jgi:hypothetical protein
VIDERPLFQELRRTRIQKFSMTYARDAGTAGARSRTVRLCDAAVGFAPEFLEVCVTPFARGRRDARAH